MLALTQKMRKKARESALIKTKENTREMELTMTPEMGLIAVSYQTKRRLIT